MGAPGRLRSPSLEARVRLLASRATAEPLRRWHRRSRGLEKAFGRRTAASRSSARASGCSLLRRVICGGRQVLREAGRAIRPCRDYGFRDAVLALPLRHSWTCAKFMPEPFCCLHLWCLTTPVVNDSLSIAAAMHCRFRWPSTDALNAWDCSIFRDRNGDSSSTPCFIGQSQHYRGESGARELQEEQVNSCDTAKPQIWGSSRLGNLKEPPRCRSYARVPWLRGASIP